MNSSLLPWGNSPWNNSLLTGCVAEQHTGDPIFLSFLNMFYVPTQLPTLLQHILVTKRKLFCPHAWEHCLLSALHPFCSVPKIYLPTELAYPALYFWLATARLLLSMLLPSLAFCLASRRPRSTFSLQKMPHWSPGIQEALLELTCWKAISDFPCCAQKGYNSLPFSYLFLWNITNKVSSSSISLPCNTAISSTFIWVSSQDVQAPTALASLILGNLLGNLHSLKF